MNELGVPHCQCAPGFSGKKCDNDMCLDLCMNGGTCERSLKKPPTCSCASGFTGKRCESVCSDPSKCDASSNSAALGCNAIECLNGGSCLVIRDQAFCRCTDDWAGLRCEDYRGTYNACKGMCLNGGVCVSTKALSAPRCECLLDWTGPHCQYRLSCQHYCFNGGTCSVNPDQDLKPSCL